MNILDEEWDYVITVCDHANETVRLSSVRLSTGSHLGLKIPRMQRDTWSLFTVSIIRMRNKYSETFLEFYNENIKNRR